MKTTLFEFKADVRIWNDEFLVFALVVDMQEHVLDQIDTRHLFIVGSDDG